MACNTSLTLVLAAACLGLHPAESLHLQAEVKSYEHRSSKLHNHEQETRLHQVRHPLMIQSRFNGRHPVMIQSRFNGRTTIPAYG